MRTPFDNMTATEVREKQWNGEVFDPRYKCYSDTRIVREAIENLAKYAEERYQQGVRDGLNIEENALAQEVERLRAVMKAAASKLRYAATSAASPDWILQAAKNLEYGIDIETPA